MCTKKDFQAYRRLLTNTVLFKYLYRILTDKANGWPVVVDNLWKDRKKWYQMYSIIRREGANARTASNLFKAFVQAVLLFRSETWVVNPHVGLMLGGFHHRVARKMTYKKHQRQTYGRWEYPPLGEVMRGEGLGKVEVYITQKQNTVAQYIATHMIMELC